jgi:hypothetical protein
MGTTQYIISIQENSKKKIKKMKRKEKEEANF